MALDKYYCEPDVRDGLENTANIRFPTECLDADLFEYVEELARVSQVPLELAAVIALSVLSGAGFSSVVVKCHVAKVTPINLFLLIGAPSALGKSSVMEPAILALREAAKLSGKRLFAEDVTSERLAKLLSENNERIYLFSSDGRKVIDVLLGCYKDKNNTDESIYLKGFYGEPIYIDRQKEKTIHLESPKINFCVAAQPDKMSKLLANSNLMDGGFLARTLLINIDTDPQLIPEHFPEFNHIVDTKWRTKIQSIFAAYGTSDEHHEISCDNAAYEIYREYNNALKSKMKSGGDLDDIVPFANRWPEMMIRIAGILHISRYLSEAHNNMIDAKTMQNAKIIVESFFSLHQQRALHCARIAACEKDISRVEKFLRSHGNVASKRDVYRNVLNSDVKLLEKLLKTYPDRILYDGKYVRLTDSTDNGKIAV